MDEGTAEAADEAAVGEYESLQQIAVALGAEQATARHLAREVHGAFAVAMTRRDALLTAWHDALHDHDTAPTPETLARCRAFARDVQAMDAYLTELTGLRREVSQYRQQVRRESSRTAIRVVRARRVLDRALFEVPAASAATRVRVTADTRSLFHDMRAHLTVAVLAAGKLDPRIPTSRMTRAHAALIRGLTALTEDLDVLDPLPADATPRLSLVPVPVPVPPVENALLPGT